MQQAAAEGRANRRPEMGGMALIGVFSKLQVPVVVGMLERSSISSAFRG